MTAKWWGHVRVDLDPDIWFKLEPLMLSKNQAKLKKLRGHQHFRSVLGPSDIQRPMRFRLMLGTWKMSNGEEGNFR